MSQKCCTRLIEFSLQKKTHLYTSHLCVRLEFTSPAWSPWLAGVREVLQYSAKGTYSVVRITINVPVVFMARYVMVLRGVTSLRGHWKGWAQKCRDFQGPPLPMPLVMMLHPSKPLSTRAIKTTGTLVVLCSRVLLCSVVCCCV